MSSERLQRINHMIQVHIDAGNAGGVVTIVSRKGRIAHFEARAWRMWTQRRPCPRTPFSPASMTKPVIGVAIMILVEEGDSSRVWRTHRWHSVRLKLAVGPRPDVGARRDPRCVELVEQDSWMAIACGRCGNRSSGCRSPSTRRGLSARTGC